MVISNRVREYVAREYIEPARRRKQPTVTVKAGDVHKAVGLTQRVPLVCQTLTGRKFLEENHLTLEKAEGPKSGLGTKMIYTYRLSIDVPDPRRPAVPSFVTLRGVGKELFRSLGGGEAFIRKERESFYGDERDK